VPNFRALIAILNDNGVEYVIVGGAAMVIQGSSYITEDLDILYHRSADNIAKLAEVLSKIRARLRVEGEPEGIAAPLDARMLAAGMNFTLTTNLGAFDVLGDIAGVGNYNEALSVADEFELIEGQPAIKVLTIDGLIIAKRAAGRTKDLVAIPELEAMRDLRDAGR
jgi:hypothetical protein